MVTLSVKILRSFQEKSKGLIGANPVYPVYFTTRWGIHTFGVLLPIDILILDNNNRVVTLCRGLAPNRVFFWNPKYDKVVELPPGTIVKKNIAAGSIIKLTYT
ncbi:MAG: DUF192 domain-containing protein [Candidatus Gottesmanbacteria bacterium]|nr:DUF192 domain-containing protein [Candidatus Gottesmanbacteria bacterium]